MTPIPPDWAIITDYLSSLAAAGQSAATIRLRRDQLGHVARELGPLEQISEQRFLDWFGAQVWRRETRRSYRNAVGFTRWAYQHGYISTDWAANLPVITPEVPAPRPTPDDVWRDAVARADERTRLMLRLAGEAGLRRGEIAQVRGDDVSTGPHLLVHGKGGKPRVIPISADLARHITACQGWVFPSRGSHLGARRVGELCSQALPAGWTLHTLRHRFATRAYRGSHDIRTVQLLLGHASVGTTQRYVQVDDADLRAAMMAAA